MAAQAVLLRNLVFFALGGTALSDPGPSCGEALIQRTAQTTHASLKGLPLESGGLTDFDADYLEDSNNPLDNLLTNLYDHDARGSADNEGMSGSGDVETLAVMEAATGNATVSGNSSASPSAGASPIGVNFTGINATSNLTANVTGNSTANGTANVTANGTANVTANGTGCVTRYDPRAHYMGYTTSPAGTQCIFGLDPRDEGSHCILDPEFGSFGWCWTDSSLSSWGSCSESCPLFGPVKVLANQIEQLRNDLQQGIKELAGSITSMPRGGTSIAMRSNHTNISAAPEGLPSQGEHKNHSS